MVIYRLPLGLSINEPKHSFCPNCKHRLEVPDLIPLLSWAFLRGKCRHCKVTVPARYFIVEVITGGLWALVWYQQLVVAWDVPRALCYFALVSALVAATFIDLRWFIIPDQINAFLLFAGLAFNAGLLAMGRPEAWIWGMPSAVVGAIVGTFSIWIVTLLGRLIFQKDAMGHGDIKLMRGIGACLFPIGVLTTFAMAILLGAVLGIIQVVLSRRGADSAEEDDSEEVPDTPESIGSIFKSGLGYFLAFDVVGLFLPKFYKSWFGEDPYSTEEVDDTWQPGFTTIPFGPYLALGAVVTATASGPIQWAISAYMKYLTGDAAPGNSAGPM